MVIFRILPVMSSYCLLENIIQISIRIFPNAAFIRKVPRTIHFINNDRAINYIRNVKEAIVKNKTNVRIQLLNGGFCHWIYLPKIHSKHAM